MEVMTRTQVLVQVDRAVLGVAGLYQLAYWLAPHLPLAPPGNYQYVGVLSVASVQYGVAFTLDGDEAAALAAIREAVSGCPYPFVGVEVL